MSTNNQMPLNKLHEGSLMGPGDEDLSYSSDIPVLSAHGFKVSGIGFLLSENDYAEVFNDLAVCRLPNTPRWFIGMANMRGTPVPVIDLALLLSITDKPAVTIPKVLVIGQREKSLGMIIDGYPVHLSFPENEEFTELPELPGSLNKYAESYYMQENMKWIAWNKSKLVDEIANQISAQQRLPAGH